MTQIRILVTTDNHLGHHVDDKITGNDSFVALEEVLQIGQDSAVDLVLFGGDLFDKQEMDSSVLNKCVDIMRKTIGRKREFDQLLDLEKTNEIKIDEHSIPAILINGNHDAPMNPNSGGNVDTLEKTGFFKWIGKVTNFDFLEVHPIFVIKKEIKIAIYGFGYIKDERLNKLLKENRFEFVVREKSDFKILVFHQNSHKLDKSGVDKKHSIELKFLPNDFFDLIVWGHEHESFVTLQKNNSKGFMIYQPGSTIPTKLIPAESSNKHAGILVFQTNNFYLETVQLKFQRPIFLEKITFSEILVHSKNKNSIESHENMILDYISDKCVFRNDLPPEKLPYVRFKLYLDSNIIVNTYILENYFNCLVANPGFNN